MKCSQHDGDDPCQLCLRAGRRRDQCVLERLPSKARATRRQTPTVAASVAPLPHVTDSLATTGTTTTTTATGVLTETGLPTKSEYSSQSLLCSLDDDSVTEVVEIFSRKFPELSFVHIADFLQRLRTSQRQILLVKMAAILALCARFVPSALCHFESPRAASEHYAAFVQQRLWPHIIHEPDAEMVHCLLLIAQYEWGEGNSFAAWMYTGECLTAALIDIERRNSRLLTAQLTGMAIRMMQGLQAATDTASTSTESVLESGPSRDAVCKREIQRRTVWACFTMDRTICCGRDRPTILRTSEMTLYLPAGEDDFDLGIPPSEPITYGQVMTQDPASCARLFTIADYYTVVIRSLDIWSHACRWVANGGRRQASALETCPWETGSEWHRIATTLEQWRSLWHFRLKYPQTPTSIYLHRRQGERFAFVNLIYYLRSLHVFVPSSRSSLLTVLLSVIILYREYVPFVPALHSGLRGPIDAPLLVREAPVGWWTEYSKTLFDASAQISRLLTEMKAAKLCFMTPIVGYGAFSAASMNVYLAAFPWVDPASSESVDATQLSRHDLEYLHDFAEMWPLGKPWVSQEQTMYSKSNIAGHA